MIYIIRKDREERYGNKKRTREKDKKEESEERNNRRFDRRTRDNNFRLI